MTVLWKEFPEINRKVAFQFNYVPLSGAYLGCHCGTITGISANFGTSCYAANGGRNIEVLDTKKEAQIKYRTSAYDGQVAPKEEVEKVLQHFKDVKLKFEDINGTTYPGIVDRCSTLPLWVMSDVINYEAPARKPAGSPYHYTLIGSTSEFAKYLINNKIGYVLASPIVQNPAHRTGKNYSLNQGWFWIPPVHLERAINVAEEYGTDKFPSKEDWTKLVGMDLNYSTSPPEVILEAALNDGVFPERAVNEKRFNRDSSGRFARVSEA